MSRMGSLKLKTKASIKNILFTELKNIKDI